MMSGFRRGRVHVLAVVGFLLGAALLLSCQPAQPVPLGTPKPAEKAAATPTKAAEKVAEKPLRGGTLRVAANSDTASLDPNTTVAGGPKYELYDLLIEPDKDGNLTKEGLARDWTIGSDGKAITFKLREGIKFHDGTDFDAAAVKFNVDRIKDPATKSPFSTNYAAVASVDVVDAATVRFNLSQPDVLILPRLAGTVGGLMVSPAGIKKYGQDFGRNPVGTGPFQFVEWVSGDHVTVKRFEGYWKKDKDGNRLPYLDQLVYKVIPDVSVVVANLRTGQVDYFGGTTVGVPRAQRQLALDDPNLTLRPQNSSIMQGIGFNTKRPPFDGLALRQAVSLAVDRPGLASFFGEGGAVVQTSMFHPTDRPYDDGKAGVFPPRDLVKAKAKMSEAGYPGGGLKTKFPINSGFTPVGVAEIIKANLAEIGIDIEIEVMASAAWDTKVRQAPWDYQVATANTNITIGDPGHYFGTQYHSKGSRNTFGPYSNTKVDELLDKARGAYDQKERATLYQQAAKLMVDDAFFIPLYVENIFAGVNKRVRDLAIYSDWTLRNQGVWLAQ